MRKRVGHDAALNSPSFETARLRLDPLSHDDAPSFLRQWNDPDVGRFLWDGKPVAPETVEAVIRASQSSFVEQAFGLWTLREKSAPTPPVPSPDEGVLGCCGMRVPDGQRDPEILYALDRPMWGQGFAREAALGVLRHAFVNLGLERVTAATNPRNPASWRVLERVGMRRTGLIHTGMEDLYTYEIDREWYDAHPPIKETP